MFVDLIIVAYVPAVDMLENKCSGIKLRTETGNVETYFGLLGTPQT